MASSGQLNIHLESVDYIPGVSYGCYSSNPGLFTRGAIWMNSYVNWTLNDKTLTLSYDHEDTNDSSWYVCSVRYTLAVQWSADNVNWQDLATATDTAHYDCNYPSTRINTIQLVRNLVAAIGSVTLPASGYVRVWTAANAACPDSTFSNAYPDRAASEAVAVEIYIDVSWTATVKYNANGGSGAPADTTITQTNDSVTLTLSNTIPTRTHYRFEGWATSPSASTAQYQPGGSITIQKNSPTKTLYAVWTKYYHPGAILDGNSKWMSHDRSSGACQLLSNVSQETWSDLRTIDAPTGLGDPPAIYHNSKWYNQKKIGKE